ncbi:MAG: rRNA maturation RNase YbeY [Alphaproteobacteria bacterium]|nr:rRNA maturation RNase YbeY [Alphaproteobacteria bacterium]
MASTTGEVGDVDVQALAEAAQRALDALGPIDWELSLLLCDDAFIRPLNGQWRGKDVATDVLSFPQIPTRVPGHPPTDQGLLLGDLVISVETAARQAEERGHTVGIELRVLMVHGLCHLLGHTHAADDDRARMRSWEARLLTALGLDAAGLVERADG